MKMQYGSGEYVARSGIKKPAATVVLTNITPNTVTTIPTTNFKHPD